MGDSIKEIYRGDGHRIVCDGLHHTQINSDGQSESLGFCVCMDKAPDQDPGGVPIFVWNNGGSPGWYRITALCECGSVIGGHICSHESFAAHDMGFTSKWKHKDYEKHMQEKHDGSTWRLIWIETEHIEARDHVAFEAAVSRNKEAANG